MSRPDGNLTEACLGFEVSEALADEVKLPNGHCSCRIKSVFYNLFEPSLIVLHDAQIRDIYAQVSQCRLEVRSVAIPV